MADRLARTLLEQRIRERRLTFEEFVQQAEAFARDHKDLGTLSLRHLQRLVSGREADTLRPATARLLERFFDEPITALLAPPTMTASQDAEHDDQVDLPSPTQAASSGWHANTQWSHHFITFEVLKTTGEDLLILRRGTLVGGASALLAGTVLTEPLHQWLLPIRPCVESETRRCDFSSDELDALESLVEQLRCWSSNGNLALARKVVIAQLNDMMDRLRDASPEPLTWRAFQISAELSRVVAAMSWDAGLYRSAQKYYVASVKLAKLADDDGLAAAALAALARQCYDLGQAQDGLEIAQLAQYGSRKIATPMLRAMLATREAWGYALLGESRKFRRAVGLAEDHFAEGSSEWDHRSVRYFDAAELAGVIGGRYRDLSRHEQKFVRNAQNYTGEALRLRQPSELRARAFDLIGLGRTYLVGADPEHACDLVHQAILIAQPWLNGRVGAKFREFYMEASRYVEIPLVRDTRDLIRELAIPKWLMKGEVRCRELG